MLSNSVIVLLHLVLLQLHSLLFDIIVGISFIMTVVLINMLLWLLSGREFDKNGNLRPWWNTNVIKRFQERAQCMVDQYSRYQLNDENVGHSRDVVGGVPDGVGGGGGDTALLA